MYCACENLLFISLTMISNASICTVTSKVIISELERRRLQSSSAKSQWRTFDLFNSREKTFREYLLILGPEFAFPLLCNSTKIKIYTTIILPLVGHGWGKLVSHVMAGIQTVFENRVMSKILGPK